MTGLFRKLACLTPAALFAVAGPVAGPAAAQSTPCLGAARGADAVVITLSAAAGQSAHGAGVVWDEQGRIVTNNHVAAAGHAPMITYADGRRAAARVVATSPADDLAVLVPLTAGQGRRAGDPLPLGRAAPGAAVVAWGNPGGRGLTRSVGKISGLGRLVNSGGLLLPDMIETSAPMVPGNSGGPMFDCAGRFVGLAAAAVLTPQGSQAGFAIPAERVAQVTARLLGETRVAAAETSSKSERARLAAAGAPPVVSASVSAPSVSAPSVPSPPLPGPRLGVMVRPAADGLLVTAVSPGQAGARAGVKVGDVLRAAESRPLTAPEDVAAVLRAAETQGWAQLELARDGRLLAVMVEVKT